MSKAYPVGYGKPPKKGQFKKGKSGNPKGRPKGSKNFATELGEELAEKIMIKEDGKKKSVSKQKAMIKAVLVKALQGHPQAANVMFTMISKMSAALEAVQDEDLLTDTDVKVLEKYKSAILSEAKVNKSARKE